MTSPIIICILHSHKEDKPAEQQLEDIYDKIIDRQMWLQNYSHLLRNSHPAQHEILIKVYFGQNIMHQLQEIDTNTNDRQQTLTELLRLLMINMKTYCGKRTDIFDGLPPLPVSSVPRQRPRHRLKEFKYDFNVTEQ